MNDQAETPERQPAPAEPAQSDAAASFSQDGSTVPDDHPEIAVGAAFAGGFLLAMVLKRLAR